MYIQLSSRSPGTSGRETRLAQYEFISSFCVPSQKYYLGFYTGFFPSGGKWHYYHSVCSTLILGGSGGMLPQEIFNFTTSKTASGGF